MVGGSTGALIQRAMWRVRSPSRPSPPTKRKRRAHGSASQCIEVSRHEGCVDRLSHACHLGVCLQPQPARHRRGEQRHCLRHGIIGPAVATVGETDHADLPWRSGASGEAWEEGRYGRQWVRMWTGNEGVRCQGEQREGAEGARSLACKVGEGDAPWILDARPSSSRSPGTPHCAR